MDALKLDALPAWRPSWAEGSFSPGGICSPAHSSDSARRSGDDGKSIFLRAIAGTSETPARVDDDEGDEDNCTGC